MGNTALIAGVRYNHKETIIKLLQAGADTNMQDKVKFKILTYYFFSQMIPRILL